MDHRVSWSPAALDDVAAIAEYIERDSPAHAQAVIQKMLAAATGLRSFPQAGRTVPEFDDDEFREIFVYSYRVIYRVLDQGVLIVAVVHGRRLLNSMIDDR